MDNAMKAIMIGVGLFITIAVVSAVLIIMGMGNDMISQSTEELTGLNDQLSRQLYSKFDDRQISGSQVLGAIKEYYSKNNVSIVLFNDTKSATPVYTGAKIIELPGKVAKSYNVNSPYTSTDFEFSGTDIKGTKFTAKGEATGEKAPLANFSKTDKTAYYIAANAQYQAFCIKQNGGLVGIAFYLLP